MQSVDLTFSVQVHIQVYMDKSYPEPGIPFSVQVHIQV